VQVNAIESTNVKPKFELYPPGNRTYRLSDWDEIGSEFSLQHMSSFFSSQNTEFHIGEVPIVNEMYLAFRNFNSEDKEQPIGPEGIRVLSARAGEIIIVTMKANKAGWFEGYRSSDPDRLCGLGHLGWFKKINFT
jgi:hypothetical protein